MGKSRYQQALKGQRWERLRRQVLNEAGSRCAECGRYGNQCDHIQPMEQGSTMFDRANLKCLNRGCHIEKTRRERGASEVPGRADWDEYVRDLARRDR